MIGRGIFTLILLHVAAGFIIGASPTSGRLSSTVLKGSAQSNPLGENLRPDVSEQLEQIAVETKTRIESMVKQNKVFLFMKGNKLFPQCGFSNAALQVLRACDVEFETFDVLSDPDIRQGIKEFSDWPTIPQLYVDGEFVGGSDIMIEMFQSGDLKRTLQASGAKFAA